MGGSMVVVVAILLRGTDLLQWEEMTNLVAVVAILEEQEQMQQVVGEQTPEIMRRASTKDAIQGPEAKVKLAKRLP